MLPEKDEQHKYSGIQSKIFIVL